MTTCASSSTVTRTFAISSSGSAPSAPANRACMPSSSHRPGSEERVMPGCIFCRIASKEVPSKIVFEDEQAVAFHDLGPQAPVHVLIVPRKHLANLASAGAEDEGLLGHLLGIAARLAVELGVAESGYRVVLNVGPDAGQSVDHLHVHL